MPIHLENSKRIQDMINEKDFRQQVVDLAKLKGWKVYFTWRSIHSPAGFPDLVLVRLSRIIFAELKSEKGKVKPSQEEWLEALDLTGKVEVYLWRPKHFDAIVEVLS